MSLPDGYVELEALTITKCLNEDGDLILHTAKSDGLNSWEALGMAITTADSLRAALTACEE